MIQDKEIKGFFAHLRALNIDRIAEANKAMTELEDSALFDKLNYLYKVDNRFDAVEHKLLCLVENSQDLERRAAKFESFYSQAMTHIKKMEAERSKLILEIGKLRK